MKNINIILNNTIKDMKLNNNKINQNKFNKISKANNEINNDKINNIDRKKLIEGIINIESNDLNKETRLSKSEYDIDVYINNEEIKVINGEENIKLYKFEKEGYYYFKLIFNNNKITNLKELFEYCSNISFIDLTNFNTSNVSDMSYMFSNCYKLKEIKGINKFNTNNATKINDMFYDCNELNDNCDTTDMFKGINKKCQIIKN